MFFLEHLICNIKQGAYILAGCMVLRGHAPDVCIKKILNFGHCEMTMQICSNDLITTTRYIRTSFLTTCIVACPH